MGRMMRSMLFAAALALGTTRASAQTVVTSFPDLATVVKSGDTVDVTDAMGRTLRGTIGELSRTSLELTARKRASDGTESFESIRRFSATDIRQIRLERRDSVLNGTLIGLAVGLALAAIPAAVVACSSTYEGGSSAGECASFLAIMGGIGAGAGLALDAARVERRMVFYQASVRF
jgi:hypothetical protein